MPLMDHFHAPLHPRRHWESFHVTWAGAIADALNETLLPEGYFAEEHAHAGARIEIDVATFADETISAPDAKRHHRDANLRAAHAGLSYLPHFQMNLKYECTKLKAARGSLQRLSWSAHRTRIAKHTVTRSQPSVPVTSRRNRGDRD